MTAPVLSTDLVPRTQSGKIRCLTAQEIALNSGQGSLNVFEDQFFSPFGAKWDERSLTLPDALPFEQWSSLVALLLQHRARLPFHIADALTFGEKQFGVSYAQAVEMSGQSNRVLGQLLSLAKVAPKNRKAKLSEDHHVAVAHEPERVQQTILEMAEARQWSVEATREQVSQSRQAAANLMPKASLVPTPIAVVGEVRVRMTKEAFVKAGQEYLAREDLAWAAVQLDNYVRSFGTGETWMDPSIPTEAVYNEAAYNGSFECADAPCTALVPAIYVEAYREPETPIKERVLAFIELTGGATNQELYDAFPLAPEKTLRDQTKKLFAEGQIGEIGVDETSTSSTPPRRWALRAKAEEMRAQDADVIEGEWQNAQEAA